MIRHDRYGLPVTTTSLEAYSAYLQAVDALLAAGPDLLAGFENALRHDPVFALAEVARARVLATYGRISEAKSAADRALHLSTSATDRERSHVAALASVIHGPASDALAEIKSHLDLHPRDALVLQPATGIFGLIGFSGRPHREAEFLELMDGLAPHYGDDWWFNAIRAFAEVEGGRVLQAQERVVASLAVNPDNFNAAHVRVHVHYELQQPEEGAVFLRCWLDRTSPVGLLRGHLCWHLALLELSMDRADFAWKLYDREFGAPLHDHGPPTPPLNVLTDAASWLWRAALRGESRRDSDWQLLATLVRERYPHAGVPFADIHSAMALALTGRHDELRRLGEELDALAPSRPVCAAASDIAAGIAAFARGEHRTAIRFLERCMDEWVEVGGSRAQRDVILSTLVNALQQLGRSDDAQRLTRSRPHPSGGVAQAAFAQNASDLDPAAAERVQ